MTPPSGLCQKCSNIIIKCSPSRKLVANNPTERNTRIQESKQKKRSSHSFNDKKRQRLRSGPSEQDNTSSDDNNKKEKRGDRRSCRQGKESKRRQEKSRERRKISQDSRDGETKECRKCDKDRKFRYKESSNHSKRDPKTKSGLSRSRREKERNRSCDEKEDEDMFRKQSRKMKSSDSNMMGVDETKKKKKDRFGNSSLVCPMCFQKFHDQRLRGTLLNGSVPAPGFCQGINQPVTSSRGGATKNTEGGKCCAPCTKREENGTMRHSPRSQSVNISSRPTTAGASDRCPGVPPEWIVGPWPAPCSIAGGLGGEQQAACDCGETESAGESFLRRVLRGISVVVRPALPEAALGAMAALDDICDTTTGPSCTRCPVNACGTSDQARSSFCAEGCTDQSSSITTSSSSRSITSSSSSQRKKPTTRSSGRRVSNKSVKKSKSNCPYR